MSHGDIANAAAVKTMITSALRASWKAFDYSETPDKDVDHIHVVYTVTRRFGGTARQGGGVSPIGWLISARCVGRTVNEARAAMDDVATLDRQRVVISGDKSTPIRFYGATAPEEDDGMFSGLSQWTYVL